MPPSTKLSPGATDFVGPQPSKHARLLHLVTAAVTFFAVIFMMGAIADLPKEFASITRERWVWLVPAVLAEAATYGCAGYALTTTSGRRAPVVLSSELMVGESFTTVATPGGIGNVALAIRFLNLRGMDTPSAVSSTWLASFSNTAVEGVALVVGVLLSASTFSIANLTGGSKDDEWIVLAAIIAVAAVVTLLWGLPRLRARVVPPLHRAASNLRAVLRQPSNAARLFGTQIGYVAFQAVSLSACLRLVGLHTSFFVLLVVTIMASGAQYAVPVPGALGAPEAVLIAGLTAAGLAHGPTVAAAATYRMITYWVPSIPGLWMIHHLRHNEHL